jgi:hypothetical protein
MGFPRLWALVVPWSLVTLPKTANHAKNTKAGKEAGQSLAGEDGSLTAAPAQ